MDRSFFECFGGDLLQVVNNADRYDGVRAEVRADDERLRLVVADHANPAVALHQLDVVFELRAELRVRNVMNVALEPGPVQHRQPAPACTEVRMIVRAVKQVVHTVFFRSYPEKTTHEAHHSFALKQLRVISRTDCTGSGPAAAMGVAARMPRIPPPDRRLPIDAPFQPDQPRIRPEPPVRQPLPISQVRLWFVLGVAVPGGK